MCMYMCMYKCMSMRMCTRYGLNDRDSYSSSRWDKPESQYKCVDNVSNHAVSMCKSMYVYYMCVYKYLNMRMCTRCGLSDRISHSNIKTHCPEAVI